MASTAFWAPVHRVLARVASGALGFPLNAAPSIDFAGTGIQDHRLQYNKRGSSAALPGVLGWYGGSYVVANIQPAAAATANIAALANVSSGVAMTLVAASGAGIIKLSTAAPAVFYTNPVTVSVGVAIESLPSFLLFGTAGNFTTGFYNRSSTVGRAVSISGVAGGAGGAFLVKGYDVYGFPMSEQITVAAGANTVNGKKAFKVIASVTPQFSDAHNYSVGTADIFGFGILASFWADVDITFDTAKVTATAGFVAADTTSPATTTTGDVRGTYATQSLTDGSKRLFISVRPTLASLVTNFTTGLFGQPQA